MSSITRVVHKVLANISQAFPHIEVVPDITSYVSGGSFNNTYYVDFENGSDGNSGTSIGSPWKTLNHSVSAGDLIYVLDGVHTWTSETGQFIGDSVVDSTGTSSDYIVISAYPGATPDLRVDLTHSGSHNGHPGGAIIPIQISGSYIVFNGLTFTGSTMLLGNKTSGGACDHVVIQDCTCLGNPSNTTDEQAVGAYFLVMDFCNHITFINNTFDFSDTTNSSSELGHAVKAYVGDLTAGHDIDYLDFKYNKVYGCGARYGSVGKKGWGDYWNIQHNLFEGCLNAIGMNLNYSTTCTYMDISYNLCYEPAGNIQWTTFGMGAFFSYAELQYVNMSNVDIHDNIIWNSTSDIRFIEHGPAVTSAGGLGSAWNNVINDVRDAYLYDGTGNEFDFNDYNAYVSTATEDTWDNLNSVSGWQANDVVNTNLGVSVSGSTGNHSLVATANSPLRNAGRGGVYNSHIAFTF